MNDGAVPLKDRLRAALQAATPGGRLERHLAYWSATSAPEKVLGFLEAAQALHEQSPLHAPPKLIMLLGLLDSERLLHSWMTDPDTIRGEKLALSASEGGKNRAKWSKERDAMQAAVDAIHAERPSISFEEVKRIVARRHGYPPHALKRYTKNPASR